MILMGRCCHHSPSILGSRILEAEVIAILEALSSFYQLFHAMLIVKSDSSNTFSWVPIHPNKGTQKFHSILMRSRFLLLPLKWLFDTFCRSANGMTNGLGKQEVDRIESVVANIL